MVIINHSPWMIWLPPTHGDMGYGVKLTKSLDASMFTPLTYKTLCYGS